MKIFGLALAALLLASSAQAALLDPAQFDPAHILPPPPAPGSPQAVAELAELKAIIAARTPQMRSAARRDDGDEHPDLFQSVLPFDLAAMPATSKLLNEVVREEQAEAGAAKKYFHRDRPWIVDSSIDTCVTVVPFGADNSYPSGHATLAFAVGEVLASLLPDRAQAILQRASEFAQNRLVCGMHFRSDVVAGQQLGSLVAQALLQNAAFQTDYKAASDEIRASALQSGKTVGVGQ